MQVVHFGRSMTLDAARATLSAAAFAPDDDLRRASEYLRRNGDPLDHGRATAMLQQLDVEAEAARIFAEPEHIEAEAHGVTRRDVWGLVCVIGLSLAGYLFAELVTALAALPDLLEMAF